jgi:hypothetical protein
LTKAIAIRQSWIDSLTVVTLQNKRKLNLLVAKKTFPNLAIILGFLENMV